MAQSEKTAGWLVGAGAAGVSDFEEVTMDPSVSVSALAEEAPTLTVATIVGVTIVILVTIAVVFLLGVLIDWRQQRLLEKQLAESKRMRNQRRGNVNTHPEDDSASIANNMEESAMSTPPAEMLRSIP